MYGAREMRRIGAQRLAAGLTGTLIWLLSGSSPVGAAEAEMGLKGLGLKLPGAQKAEPMGAVTQLPYLRVEMTPHPAALTRGGQIELTLRFTLTHESGQKPVHWNNLVASTLKIAAAPKGLRAEPRKIELPRPKADASTEARQVKLRLHAAADLASGTLPLEVKLVYYLCEDDPNTGRCFRKKGTLKLPVVIGAAGAAATASAKPTYRPLKTFEYLRVGAAPAKVKPGGQAVLHLRFTLRKDLASSVHWNNLAATTVRLSPPPGLLLRAPGSAATETPKAAGAKAKDERASPSPANPKPAASVTVTLPHPKADVSHENREITIPLLADRTLAPGAYPIRARLLYFVCEDNGRCMMRKETFALTVNVAP